MGNIEKLIGTSKREKRELKSSLRIGSKIEIFSKHLKIRNFQQNTCWSFPIMQYFASKATPLLHTPLNASPKASDMWIVFPSSYLSVGMI